MFSKKSTNELNPPPVASDPKAREVLRVWALPGQAQQVSLVTMWKDPAAWGLMLADIARHAVNAYGAQGQNPKETMERILKMFQAEMTSPTDQAKPM